MSSTLNPLINRIISITRDLPKDAINVLIAGIGEMDSQNHNLARSQVLSSIPQSEYRTKITRLFDIWQQEFPFVTTKEMSIAVSTVAVYASKERTKQSLELVWTGPNPKNKPFRHTEQAILEVIDSAIRSIIIVSFAIYKPERVKDALIRAANRAVDIKFILESPHEADGKIAYSNIDALGQEVKSRAKIFIWPVEARSKNSSGKYGSLHVKCMVGDSNKAFLSSANLTQYAFMLNMELGILIKGGTVPKDIEDQINSLILHNIIVPFN